MIKREVNLRHSLLGCERNLPRLNNRQRFLMMTTPVNAIRDEVWELIHDQIETFTQRSLLTPSQLSECRWRAERIGLLGQELDRIGSTAILEKRFGKAA